MITKRKLIALILSLSLVASLGSFAAVYATSIEEQQQELSNVKEDRKEVKENLEALMEDINHEQAEIDKIQESINAKQAEINATSDSIKKTEKKIEKSKDGLNKRLRVMYKNGSVGFLDVLLGSNSISEFLTNASLIQKIYQNDQNTITVLKEQQEELEKKKSKLQTEQNALDAEKAEAVEKKAALDADKSELQAKLDELNAEAERISAVITQLQDQNKKYNGSGKFHWPTDSTYITSPFGFRTHPVTGVYTGHTGIDIGASTGSPVYAADDGTVILAEWYYGYGYAVIIDHGSGISTLYGHNSSLSVSAGQNVSKGQVIASVGSTGISTGPHCHFEVRVNGTYVDPMEYL
ncbi:MAG: peptidoglycan DD-metalloendopeptidase family protein [Eubacteriaceae bacterium]|nr:peptidoglycan DD-metalloendopeptidase family protein [Eubacteriaceae bacterium]